MAKENEWMNVLKKEKISKLLTYASRLPPKDHPINREKWYQDVVDRDKPTVGLKNKFKRALSTVARESTRLLIYGLTASVFWMTPTELGMDKASAERARKFARNATPEDKEKEKQWIRDNVKNSKPDKKHPKIIQTSSTNHAQIVPTS